MPSNLGAWADSPFQLIPTPLQGKDPSKEHAAITAATMMVQVHNILLRGLNAIYIQAPNVRDPSDIRDFLQFTQLWVAEITEHHEAEEEFVFPELEKCTGKKGIMDANVEQHQAFHHGLKELEEYVTGTTAEAYDAKRLLSIIDSFATVLQQHLTDEISTLLALKDYDHDAIIDVLKRSHEYALKNVDRHRTLPVLLGCFDRTYEGKAYGFDIPWVGNYLVYFVFSWKHAPAWRFLPSTFWGQPRPLPFASKFSSG